MWKFLASTVIFGSAAAYVVRRYFTGTSCKCTARLDGLVVVVTGASSGIGNALSLLLAERGATLVLACRNVEKGIETKRYIQSKLKNKGGKIYVKELNLMCFTSIRRFAESLKSEFSEIYALVNNAGVFYFPPSLTVDGFDATMQTNYFGPFVLTHLLLPLLEKSDLARIINVISEAHKGIKDEETLFEITKNSQKTTNRFLLYSVSKLGLHCLSVYLPKIRCHSNLIVNSVDPGNVETNIFRYFPPLSNPWLFALQWPIRIFVIKTPTEGAQTVLHAILTPNRTTGQLYKDCKLALGNPLVNVNQRLERYYKMTYKLVENYLKEESEC